MRVLMCSWEYPPNIVGGLGKHVTELIPALLAHGVSVHLVTPQIEGGEPEEQDDDSLLVRRVPVPEGDAAADFYEHSERVNRALQQAGAELIAEHGPYDLIHNHDWLTASAAVALKHAHRIPLLATIHATERGRCRGEISSPLSQRIADAEWRLTYEAWRIICCTHYMAGEVRAQFQTPDDKIDVVPNGVDPAPFEALEEEDLSVFRTRYALPEEQIVLHVGRMVIEKGVWVLLESAPQVLAKVPTAKFVIAGRGPELDWLRHRTWQLGLSHKVLFPGFIADEMRNRLYVAADCAVFPSLYEPIGIVALEAMAARTPVVVSETGGLTEVVRHGETGITIYPGDPASCAWGIIHTLQHPEWAQQRAQRAYEEVLTTFNWENIAARTIAVYEQIVAERRAAAW